jgi:hypothetical protein
MRASCTVCRLTKDTTGGGIHSQDMMPKPTKPSLSSLSSSSATPHLVARNLFSVFDIGGGRPKIGHLALPRKLLSAFWYEGKPYEFNFSKAWTRVHMEF